MPVQLLAWVPLCRNIRQVSHTLLLLSPSSIIWCQFAMHYSHFAAMADTWQRALPFTFTLTIFLLSQLCQHLSNQPIISMQAGHITRGLSTKPFKGSSSSIWIMTVSCIIKSVRGQKITAWHETDRLSPSLILSRYQNVFILDFTGSKDNGCGANKTCNAPVKLSPPTNQHPDLYRLDALPIAQPTLSDHLRQ